MIVFRYGLNRQNKCCYNYEIPKSYISLIVTNATYVNRDINVIDTKDAEEEWIDI